MKKIKLLVIALLVVMVSGCMRVRVSMDFDADGKAKMSMSMLMKESMMKMAEMDIDDLKENFGDVDEDDFKFKQVEETIDKEKYVGWEATSKKAIPFDSSFSTLQGEVDVDKENNRIEISLDADDLTESMEQSSQQYSAQDMKDFGVSMDLVFHFEGEVISANGEIGDDKKSVTYDLLTFDEDYIEIEAHLSGSSSDQTMMYIIIGVLAVVAIGGIAFFIIKKKKKDENHSDMTFEPSNQDSASEQKMEDTKATPDSSGETQTTPELETDDSNDNNVEANNDSSKNDEVDNS